MIPKEQDKIIEEVLKTELKHGLNAYGFFKWAYKLQGKEKAFNYDISRLLVKALQSQKAKLRENITNTDISKVIIEFDNANITACVFNDLIKAKFLKSLEDEE